MKKGLKWNLIKNLQNKMKQNNDQIWIYRPNTTLDHINYEMGKTKPPLKWQKKIDSNNSPLPNQKLIWIGEQGKQSTFSSILQEQITPEETKQPNRIHGWNSDLSKSYDLKSTLASNQIFKKQSANHSRNISPNLLKVEDRPDSAHMKLRLKLKH